MSFILDSEASTEHWCRIYLQTVFSQKPRANVTNNLASELEVNSWSRNHVSKNNSTLQSPLQQTLTESQQQVPKSQKTSKFITETQDLQHLVSSVGKSRTFLKNKGVKWLQLQHNDQLHKPHTSCQHKGEKIHQRASDQQTHQQQHWSHAQRSQTTRLLLRGSQIKP